MSKKSKGTVGHTGTYILDPNALGDLASTLPDSGLVKQVESLSEESPFF
ncbi:MAG: transposase [Moorea sp. SIO3I6]|nr:transposase [Moorena sp. SIO3I8]NEO21922.1 transposase [Moorena sp. SIO4A5]NEP24533.1 transposase [Moorena sp. SIO3I6]NEQ56903.1 transposase [Moorena sp. SIO4A1]